MSIYVNLRSSSSAVCTRSESGLSLEGAGIHPTYGSHHVTLYVISAAFEEPCLSSPSYKFCWGLGDQPHFSRLNSSLIELTRRLTQRKLFLIFKAFQPFPHVKAQTHTCMSRCYTQSSWSLDWLAIPCVPPSVSITLRDQFGLHMTDIDR